MPTDILDEIRGLAPADTGWAHSPEGDRVLERAVALARSTNAEVELVSSRFPRGMVAAGAAVVVVSSVAAAVTLSRSADRPAEAICYETLSAQADTVEAAPGLVQQLGPAAACGRTWLDTGVVVDTANLVSCVNPTGGRGIFPAPRGLDAAAACGQIGWAVDDTLTTAG